MRFCDACGACMTHPKTGADVIGMMVSISDEALATTTVQECIPRHKSPGTYAVCFSCLLEAVGVKPNLDPGIDSLIRP